MVKLQKELDLSIDYTNNEKECGKMGFDKIPMQVFNNGKQIWKQKKLGEILISAHNRQPTVKNGNCQIKSQLLQFKQ